MRTYRLPRNSLNTGELYHIELESRFEIDKFLDWMEKRDTFPFSIYLQGITYTFTSSLMCNMFVVAFHAAREAFDHADDEEDFLSQIDGVESV